MLQADRLGSVIFYGPPGSGKTALAHVIANHTRCVFRQVNAVATGISDSSLLPGVKLTGQKAITHSILMRARSRTIRYIRAVHDLGYKSIHLRSLHADRRL